ncbi:hypothetical protein LMG26824_04263 [Stenotrophomonas maltophilia]
MVAIMMTQHIQIRDIVAKLILDILDELIAVTGDDDLLDVEPLVAKQRLSYAGSMVGINRVDSIVKDEQR